MKLIMNKYKTNKMMTKVMKKILKFRISLKTKTLKSLLILIYIQMDQIKVNLVNLKSLNLYLILIHLQDLFPILANHKIILIQIRKIYNKLMISNLNFSQKQWFREVLKV